jgi:uncharacterized protein (TIGR03067 family)
MVAFVVAALVAFADPPAVDAPADERAIKEILKFQGTWHAVSAEADGTKLPAEAINGFIMVVEGNTIVFTPKVDKRQSTFAVDPTKSPKQIIFTPLDGPRKGETQRAIYAFEGGQLKLLVNNDPNGKRDAPTEFSTRRGDGLRLLVLKQAQPKSDEPQ